MSGTWATDWATNDVVTATEFRKSLGCVVDSTLGASAATIDFTGLPTTYAHLFVVCYLRSDAVVTGAVIDLRLNNDSGANYSTQTLTSFGATTSSAENLGATNGRVGRCPGASAPANEFSASVFEIPFYAGATNHKAITARCSSREGTTTGTAFAEIDGSLWFAAGAAVNRVTLFPSVGNFVAGSRVSVYVMGS